MISKIKVVCPHCRAEQDEVESAISTFCRSCGRHFAVQGVPRKKAGKMPRTSRVIRCRECGVENKLAAAALSTQCVGCVAYMDLQHHEITGASNQKLNTYGEIHFAPGCTYRGGDVLALRVRVAGRVQARIVAEEEIELMANCSIQGSIESPAIRVTRNAQAEAGSVKCRNLHLGGALRAHSAEVAEKLHVHSGGGMTAQQIRAHELEVEEGGAFSVQDFETLRHEPEIKPEPFHLEAEDPAAE
jgi:cytoskeletal protein CcmA (bactofilin family)